MQMKSLLIIAIALFLTPNIYANTEPLNHYLCAANDSLPAQEIWLRWGMERSSGGTIGYTRGNWMTPDELLTLKIHWATPGIFWYGDKVCMKYCDNNWNVADIEGKPKGILNEEYYKSCRSNNKSKQK